MYLAWPLVAVVVAVEASVAGTGEASVAATVAVAHGGAGVVAGNLANWVCARDYVFCSY